MYRCNDVMVDGVNREVRVDGALQPTGPGRQALGDNGRDQAVIRTAHGRGYRFVAEVTMTDERSLRPTAPDRPRRPSRPNPVHPRSTAPGRWWADTTKWTNSIGSSTTCAAPASCRPDRRTRARPASPVSASSGHARPVCRRPTSAAPGALQQLVETCLATQALDRQAACGGWWARSSRQPGDTEVIDS